MAELKRLPPINEEVKERFVKNVEKRKGGTYGHLRTEVERALNEYINASQGGDTHDRLRRIENDIEEIKETVGKPQSEEGNDSVSKTTKRRINKIMSDIQDRAEQLGSKRVTESDVEAAIENNAGVSHKTIQRYKKLLQNQKEIFAHPTDSDVYFIKATAFIAFVEQQPNEIADDILETYGVEWWQENAPEGLIDWDEGRAFQ